MKNAAHNRISRLLPLVALTALATVAPAQENVWTSHGPTDVGWINDLAIVDSAAYAATLNGVFRSEDRAASWQQSGLAGEWIIQIVSASDAAVVLARGPGSVPGGGGTLYASRDVGETWAPVPGLPPVTQVAIDPRQPSTAYVGVDNAEIWKSTDAGSSWQHLSATPGGYGPLVFAFDSRAIYVMAFDNLDNLYKLYKSLDGGVSWATVSSPIPYPTTIAAGAAPGIVYTGGLRSFCRSADSAATWTCWNFPQFPIRIVEVPGDGPGAPHILAVSGNGVYVSRDGGATWALGDGELRSVGYATALASDASGSLVLAGTVTQVFRSQDRGDSWTSASAGLHSSWINALALDPHDPSTVWAAAGGSPKSGLFRSADRGLSWSLGNGPPNSLSVRALVIGPEHPSRLYASGFFSNPEVGFPDGSAVYRSDDGGEHWSSSNLPAGASVEALAVDARSPERVWAASHGGLFRSEDGAQTWTSPPAVAQGIYCILFDGKRPGTMYAGSYFDVESGFYPEPYGGSIFVSRDSGANWTKRAYNIGSSVLAIATDPFHDGVLYVGTYIGVFRSADDGVTWQGPSLGLPPSAILTLVADPVRPGRLYTTTDGGGVYRTIDGAQTWHAFSSGLGSLQARPLVISPDGRWLHVGTYGGGVFELDLEGLYPCTPNATRLCLLGNRYAADLLAASPGESPHSPGAAQLLSDRSGYFGLPFATGDPEFPEVVVKMLPEGAFGASGAPIFYSSLTTLPYLLTVTDTITGQQRFYASDPSAPLCGGADISIGAAEASPSPRAAVAVAGETALVLYGRFAVTLEARQAGSGRVATGAVISSADRYGFFSIPDFTGDPQFPEVVVKMIDARAITGEFWFFYTGLTSLDFTLTVRDSVTGAVRTYESATQFCGGADVHAFGD